MRGMIGAACGLVMAATAAVACDQAEAGSALEDAARVGLVAGLDVTPRTVVLYLPRAEWERADVAQRRHLARLVQCAVAGPDRRLQRLELRDAGGVLVGVFDGVRDALEVMR